VTTSGTTSPAHNGCDEAPRHLLVLAQQALALHDLAPRRFRLGIGHSHRFIIENMYGLQHSRPLAYLREYVEVLRTALRDGNVDHQSSIMLKPCFRVRRRFHCLFLHLERLHFD